MRVIYEIVSSVEMILIWPYEEFLSIGNPRWLPPQDKGPYRKMKTSS